MTAVNCFSSEAVNLKVRNGRAQEAFYDYLITKLMHMHDY